VITESDLRKRFHYDELNGIFTYKVKPCQRMHVGDEAGYTQHGYRNIVISGKTYKAHRLAWLYVYGVWPEQCIDHINGDRGDNRISNLRCATISENSQNQRKAKKSNKTGFLGVSPRGRRFKAQISVSGNLKVIGIFDTPEEAHFAYVQRKREIHAACTI
jgi:hypothetical protein